MTRDILADAREFIGDRHERLQTHSEGCWRWHPACMVGRLAREVERLRTIMHRIVDEDCTVAIQGGTFYADGEPLFAVGRTPAQHTTPGEGSTPREGTSEPVALGTAHGIADTATVCGPGDAKRLGAANSDDDRRSVGGE